MAEWFLLNPEEFASDEEAQKAKQLAYFNTFYGSEEGRQVMFDLMRLCNDITNKKPDAVIAQLALYQYIRACCGITADKEKEIIDAEASII